MNYLKKTNRWKSHQLRVNNVKIHYIRAGKGMPLILLHGWPEFCYTWHKIIPLLCDQFDVIAPDLRGFGQSEKPQGSVSESYTLNHHVEDLIALANTLELNQFGIVSHDIGSSIAQQFAREHSKRVIGLFFFNVSYPGFGSRWAKPARLNDIWYQGFHQQSWAVELLNTSPEALRVYLGNILSQWAFKADTFDDELDIWIENFLIPGNLQGGFNWYKAMFPLRLKMASENPPVVPSLDLPTCVRWGREDPVMLIDYADLLHDYFTHLDFKAVDAAGHFVHYERPQYAGNEIKHFFKELPYS